MIQSQLTLLPAVLLAIAGVLVDATFRSDAYRDRIWAQVVLWLAASLQGNEDEGRSVVYVFIHGTFFLSVASAAYQAFMVQCRWTASDSIRADYSRFLAPSMVLPLIYNWMYLVPPSDMHSAWMNCTALFLLGFVSLCTWRWMMLRKRRVRQDLIGMPTVESMQVFQSSRSIEERLWMEWSPSEVLTWIHSLEGDDWSIVCSQLAPERIPGRVLENLTVTDLRSMGLPYGLALCLVDKIADLTTQHPSSVRTNRYRDPEQDELEVDEWFNDARPSTETLQPWENRASVEGLQAQTAQRAKAPPLSVSADFMMSAELSEEAIQKAKDLFREQFGLELPEIKMRPIAADALLADDEVGRYIENIPVTTPEPATTTGVAATSQNQVVGDFPKNLLDSMPPRVREVAEQQPDLVQMLWTQRQEGKSVSAVGSARIHQLRMQDPAYAQRFVGAQAAAEFTGIPMASDDQVASNADSDDMPEHVDGDERTGLLRKRAARPPKYAAIR